MSIPMRSGPRPAAVVVVDASATTPTPSLARVASSDESDRAAPVTTAATTPAPTPTTQVHLPTDGPASWAGSAGGACSLLASRRCCPIAPPLPRLVPTQYLRPR